jgi:N-acetylneuraminic acid mutarotase
MGKKDKKADPAKVQAKKARQALKQEKVGLKRTKKELKDTGEEDIEKIIAEFTAKDAARTLVAVSLSPQPSRRANFSMTALPNGELLLFGGECCDGERTEVFNELFRWNVEKNEWKIIESLNTPPPRCSHQTILYNDKIYMFGGEYATMDQFYHYRDFWELDLKTNAWKEIAATGDLPSARSGHRMIVWRNYLLMFGGFYEAMREVRWFNDLYIFSFQTRRWTLLSYKANTQIPKPRSGVQMSLHVAEDLVYIFGGYSKEKSEGSRQEGKIHEDMWMLSLKPCLPTTKTGTLDLTKVTWQKISRKGDYPTPRCGGVMTVYKNKAILFGGVQDVEGSYLSVFVRICP